MALSEGLDLFTAPKGLSSLGGVECVGCAIIRPQRDLVFKAYRRGASVFIYGCEIQRSALEAVRRCKGLQHPDGGVEGVFELADC